MTLLSVATKKPIKVQDGEPEQPLEIPWAVIIELIVGSALLVAANMV